MIDLIASTAGDPAAGIAPQHWTIQSVGAALAFESLCGEPVRVVFSDNLGELSETMRRRRSDGCRPVGYVCPTTGRVAVRVADFARSDLNGDAPAYLLNEEAEEMGLDGWRLIEGVDISRDGSRFEIWGVANWSKVVGPDFTIYVSAKHAAELAAVAVARP